MGISRRPMGDAPTRSWAAVTVACRLAPSGRLAQVYRALYRGASGSEKWVKKHVARGETSPGKNLGLAPALLLLPVASGGNRRYLAPLKPGYARHQANRTVPIGDVPAGIRDGGEGKISARCGKSFSYRGTRGNTRQPRWHLGFFHVGAIRWPSDAPFLPG